MTNSGVGVFPGPRGVEQDDRRTAIMTTKPQNAPSSTCNLIVHAESVGFALLGRLFTRSPSNPIKQQKSAYKKRKYAVESVARRVRTSVNRCKNSDAE